ncbi:MAG: hypothetical protein V1929_06250 [bacterium]
MSKKPRPTFIQPWPMAFSSARYGAEHVSRALAGYAESRRRLQAWLASPKSLKIQTRFRAAMVEWLGTGDDLVYAESDLTLLSTVAKVFDLARARDVASSDALRDFLHWCGGIKYHIDRFGFDAIDAISALLDDDKDRERICLDQFRRSMTLTANSPLLTAFACNPDFIMELAEDFAPTLAPRDILLLVLPFSDDAAVLLLDVEDPAESLDALLVEARHRMETLMPIFRDAAEGYNQIVHRVEMTETFLFETLDQALDPKKTAMDFHVFLLLAKMRTNMCTQLRGLARKERERYTLADNMSDEAAGMISTSECFWYVALFQELARTDGISGDRLKPWVRPLLADMLNHPSKLIRMPVTREGEKTRTALSRHIAPYLRGPHHAGTRRLFTQAALDNAPDAQVLRMVAEEISLSNMRPDTPFVPLNDDQSALIRQLWKQWSEPFMLENLDFLCRCTQAAGQTVSIFDLHLPPEPEVSRTIEQHLDLAEDDATPLPPEPAAPVVRVWHMVRDPGHGLAQAKILVWNDDSPGTDTSSWIREHLPTLPIPAESLTSALDYYASMSPVTRALLPHESISGFYWRKLKRGKARILVREEDSRMIFHAFPRKDWVSRGRLR